MVNKPPSYPVHPTGSYRKNSMTELLVRTHPELQGTKLYSEPFPIPPCTEKVVRMPTRVLGWAGPSPPWSLRCSSLGPVDLGGAAVGAESLNRFVPGEAAAVTPGFQGVLGRCSRPFEVCLCMPHYSFHPLVNLPLEGEEDLESLL